MGDLEGRTLGHYRIVERLGAGGMGEVYRARDERLDREVAIKVLPEAVANDPDRMRRFEREAKALAALNHPNIATIHGLEEEENGRFLVMELVEGESLASVIARGRLPIDAALPIALQIARALETAHDHGIIHRDLKPANVMVDADCQVKVLDFGLAKAWEREGVGADLTHSPTLSVQMTADGVILGTAAYMSPEQARGRPVDKRSDVWAFGVVLYEMLTGSRAFCGDTATDILATIIKDDPDWDALPRETPTAIRRMLRRCLSKDPRDRIHDIADARIEVEDFIQRPDEGADPTDAGASRAGQPMWLRVLPWALVPVAAMVVWLAAVSVRREATPTAADRRLEINPPEGERVGAVFRHALALSPNGRTLAFVTSVPRVGIPSFSRSISLRPLNQWESRELPGTEGGTQPVFSPDGRWLLFVTGSAQTLDTVESESNESMFSSEMWTARTLEKIALDGGERVRLCECDASFGASWGADGTIVFAGYGGPLNRIPSTGGVPEPLTTLDEQAGEGSHRLPHFLPDGKAVVYTAVRKGLVDWGEARIFVHDLETGERRLLIEDGADGRYVPTGHLVFARENRLLAVPFDRGRREVTGQAVPVLDGVARSIHIMHDEFDVGACQLTFSSTGLMAYAPGFFHPLPPNRLVAVDRQGMEEVLAAEPLVYFLVRAAANGRRLLAGVGGRGYDVWTIDLERGSSRPQLLSGATLPIWGPGPDEFTYGMAGSIYVNTVDSDPEKAERLPIEIADPLPNSWSPDRKFLAVAVAADGARADIWVFSSGRGTDPYVKTEFDDAWAEFSPDGRWMAYASTQSGRYEVYVRPFPGPGRAVQISTGGGVEPAWSPRGRELFFTIPHGSESGRWGTSVFSVPLDVIEGELHAGKPQLLFTGPYMSTMPSRSYDLLPDGRFVFIRVDDLTNEDETSFFDAYFPDRIRVVEDWFEELKRLAPTN